MKATWINRPILTVSEIEVKFYKFPGFVEEIYNCIPDKEKCYWTTSWNWGDDEIMNTGRRLGTWLIRDLGNFWGWQAEDFLKPEGWLDKSSNFDPTSTNKFNHCVWPHAWYSILERLISVWQIWINWLKFLSGRKDIIAGQPYFFRAWWHFELMEHLGGLPMWIRFVFQRKADLTAPYLSGMCR